MSTSKSGVPSPRVESLRVSTKPGFTPYGVSRSPPSKAPACQHFRGVVTSESREMPSLSMCAGTVQSHKVCIQNLGDIESAPMHRLRHRVRADASSSRNLERRQNPAIRLSKRAFHDERASYCCLNKLKQPLGHVALGRTHVVYVAAPCDAQRPWLHDKGFNLVKTARALFLRCLTAPPLCAPD